MMGPRVTAMTAIYGRRVAGSLVSAALTALIFFCPAYAKENPEAAAISTPVPLETGGLNPFLSDRYRYENMWLFPRLCSSVLACGISFVDWDAYDWLTAGGIIASTAAFMTPFDGLSADARIHQWVSDIRNRDLKYLFPHVDTLAWSGVVASWGLIFYGSGLIFKNSRLLEYISLTLEAIGVTQFYHVTFKLIMGREGPPNGDGRGVIYGPRRSLNYFPYGTPSGHIATLYAMTTVAAEYFDSLALRIISHVLGVYYAVNLIYNQQHFVSDIIWGASMGYFIGHWIVKHRSSRYAHAGKKRTGGITIIDAGPDQPGEVVAFPFFNADAKSFNLCVNYIF